MRDKSYNNNNNNCLLIVKQDVVDRFPKSKTIILKKHNNNDYLFEGISALLYLRFKVTYIIIIYMNHVDAISHERDCVCHSGHALWHSGPSWTDPAALTICPVALPTL